MQIFWQWIDLKRLWSSRGQAIDRGNDQVLEYLIAALNFRDSLSCTCKGFVQSVKWMVEQL
jgi:hypothetical protein